ncbi:hypothetical protein ARMSODRAFT_883890, partial [Armillaria solidipes]
HYIQIVEWLEGVEFRSLSDIGPTEDLHTLHNALRSRAYHWACMSKWEIEEFEKELAQREKKKTWKIHKNKDIKQ